MKIRISPVVALLFFAGLAVGDALYHAPLLPERIASHFGPDGRADGWMSREAFLATNLLILCMTAGVLSGVSLLLKHLPSEMINLPHREFWLAPERRAATLRTISDQMLWFGAATTALLAAIMHLVLRANLQPEPLLGDTAWFYLVAYLAFATLWTIGLFRRFALPKA